MNETLVIIDMQPDFAACNSERLIRACQREIRQAMQDCNGIVYVRYKDHKSVHKELLDLTLLYSHKAITTKDRNDGSKHVLRTISRRGFCRTRLRICGINAQYCVHETILGLRMKLPHSRLIAVADAINTVNYRYDMDDLQHRKRVDEYVDGYGIEVVNRHLLLPEAVKEEAA
jgi:hypothetical protein